MPAHIDMSQVGRLSNRLGAQGPAIRAQVRPVMARAGMNMKRQGAAEAAGVQHGRISSTWGYDVKASGLSVEAGPRSGGDGGLAFFYYGNSKIGPRLPDPIGLLQAEAENAKTFLLAAVELGMRA